MSRLDGTVNTVAGPLVPSALGPTTMHEHILTVRGETWRRRYLQRLQDAPDDIWDEPITLATRGRLQHSFTAQRANLTLDDDHIATAELRDLAQPGGRSLVEASGIGLRGDPGRIAAAAARSRDPGDHVDRVLLLGLLARGLPRRDRRRAHRPTGARAQ